MFRNAPKARLDKAIYTKHETPWYLENVNSMSSHTPPHATINNQYHIYGGLK